MRPFLTQLCTRACTFSMAVACLMMVIAASLGLFQILMRFVFAQPAEWTEVLIRFSLIWMVFMGIPEAFRQGAMVSVDVLHRMAPERAKRVLDALVAIASLALLAVLIYWGFNYAMRGRVQSVIGLEGVSMFWAYLAIPVGAAFAVMGVIGNYLSPMRLELENAQ
jgi:TRAP-type C4-dicarboxylate transport system permease small subunit